MEKQPFLSVADFHLIIQQLNKIINAYAMSKDSNVIQAVKGLVETELKARLVECDAQEEVIKQMLLVTERTDADLYIHNIQQYVVPFKQVSDSNLASLFKKEKKLKLPNMKAIDLSRTVYLAWDNPSNHHRYMVIEQNGKLKGLKGLIDNKVIKGICSICNHHADVSLFTTTVKGNTPDHFIKHSNYICTDSQNCNTNVSDTSRIIDFFNYMQK